MVNFITYLSGNRNWIQPHSIIPAVKPDSPELVYMRELLGTESLANCIVLYRLCQSLPVIAANLPRETAPLDFAAIQQAASQAEVSLIPTGTNVAASLPLPRDTVNVPVYRLKYISDTKAEILGPAVRTVVNVSLTEDILTVQWPSDWDITGALRLPSTINWLPGTSFVLPTRTSYPVHIVDKLLCRSNEFYDILFAQGLVETFYSADSPEERVGIGVLALINLAKV